MKNLIDRIDDFLLDSFFYLFVFPATIAVCIGLTGFWVVIFVFILRAFWAVVA